MSAPVADLQLLATFDRNLRWAKAHPSELRPHRGRFVIVSGKRVVSDAATQADATARASALPGAYVTYVPSEPLAWVL